MEISKNPEYLHVFVGNQPLQKSDQFKYRESLLTNDGYSTREISSHIAMALLTSKWNPEVLHLEQQHGHTEEREEIHG